MSTTKLEQLQNIFTAGVRLFIKDKEKAENATPAELHQAMIEANEDLKTETINAIVQTMTTEFNTQVEQYTAQLQTTFDTIVGEFRTQLTDFETRLSALQPVDNTTEITSLKTELSNLKTEFGSQLNEIKTGKPTATNGDGKVIETHVATVERKAIIKPFGSNFKAEPVEVE